jgi:hypothetical protein
MCLAREDTNEVDGESGDESSNLCAEGRRMLPGVATVTEFVTPVSAWHEWSGGQGYVKTS